MLAKAKRAKADAAAAAAAEKEERERDVGMDVDMVNDMDLDVSPQEQSVAMDVDVEEKDHHQEEIPDVEPDDDDNNKDDDPEEEEDDLHLMQNTVDFALREREEMRDLTKASEIISLYPHSSSPPGAVAAPSDPLNPTASTPIPPSHAGVDGDPTPVWDPRVGQGEFG